jgi:diaminopimelate decarboxylase
MDMAVDLTGAALRALDPDALARLETPCHVFDPAVAAEDHAALRAALGTPLVVSMKANPLLDMLVRCNHVFGDGIEIASMGELNVTVGRMTVPRYCNTPALDPALIAAALACKATIIADSLQQVRWVVDAARQTGKAVRLGLRLNAASVLQSARGADHFGIDVATLPKVLDELAQGPVKAAGLHVFAGSNSFEANGLELARAMTSLVAGLADQPGAALEFVNLGGGLPARWRTLELDFEAYGQAIAPLRARVQVLHEAGRAVFARSGHFLTRVVATKTIDGREIAVCDGGLAQCFSLAQTEHFARRPPRPRVVRHETGAARAEGAGGTVDLVGSSCSPADRIGVVEGERLAPGDLLVFDDCGAYHTYSPTGFLNLRAAQRYLVS